MSPLNPFISTFLRFFYSEYNVIEKYLQNLYLYSLVLTTEANVSPRLWA
jgi:hypothetical protein